jgi:hypothetical protein
MDLKTFVAESLKQIAEGIKDAQAANTGAWIAPRVDYDGKGKLMVADNMARFAPQMVSFDVAISAAEEGSKNKDGMFKIAVVSFGGSTESHTQNSTISRIKFEMPICWPEGKRPGYGS